MGAIVVTTKKGYKGKAKISLSANWGWSKPTNIPRMANAAQYMELRNDAAILGEGNPLVTKEELELCKTGASGYASTDLYDHVIRIVLFNSNILCPCKEVRILSHTLVVLAMHLMKGC